MLASTPLTFAALGPPSIGSGTASIYNGQGPWSGRVTTIAHDPSNADVAYLGGADGGVWKTVDAGVHWAQQKSFDSEDSIAMGSLAVDPGNSQVVYAGTGEPNGSDGYLGAGIFRSANGGSTWTKIGGTTFDNCPISAIVVQPGASANVLVAVSNHNNSSASCLDGIFRSTNANSATPTFTHVITGDATDLATKPGTPTTWYAGFWGFGVYVSTNAGVNWTASALNATLPSGVSRIALAVSPANPSRIYAAIGSPDGAALGVWTSTTSGSSWTQLPYTNFCAYHDTDAGGQCDYDLTVAAYPATDGFVYVGGIRVQRYDGTSWTTLGFNGCAPSTSTCDPTTTATGIHVDIHSNTFDAANRLWVGTDGGAYRKNAGSVDFTNVNATLRLNQFYPGITGSPQNFLGGVQDNGSLQYTSAAQAWSEFAAGDGGYTAPDATSGYRFSTYIYGTVFRTDASGNQVCTFSAADPSKPENYAGWSSCGTHVTDGSEFVAPLVPSPTIPGTLYVGTDRVRKTVNDGVSWTPGTPFSGHVTAIAEAASSSNTVYAAWSKTPSAPSATSAVRISSNGGATWTATASLPNRFISDIAIKKTAPNDAWVTVSQYNASTPTTPGHVFLTQDSGAHWANISGNLPDVPVRAIDVDSSTSPSTLYVGTDVGLFTSTDGGTTWGKTSQGIPNSVVTDVHLDPTTNSLIVATHGRGAYVASLGSASYTTKWTSQELPRVLQDAAYFNFTPQALQKWSVQAVAYALGLQQPANVTAMSPPPANTGPTSYTTTWSSSETAALYLVMNQYALTPEQAQKACTNIVSFVLAAQGH